MNQKKKWFLITLLMFFVLAVACFIALCNYDRQYTDYGRRSNYLSNRGYARALGANSFEYDVVLQKFGDPISATTIPQPDQHSITYVSLEYPEFRVDYVETQELNGSVKRTLYLMTVLSKYVQFGKNKIGIGSSQAEVHKAYACEPMIAQDELVYSAEVFPEVAEGFYGEDWSRILFCYNDDGIVTAIAYEPPAF